MRKLINSGLLMVIALLLTGCAENKAKLTITPYTMSEKELELMSKTDVEQIDFFYVNGSLEKGKDLRFSVEMYKNGELAGELLTTHSEIQTKFDDTLISFAIEKFEEDEQRFLKLVAGLPSGKATTYYANKMTASTSTSLIHEKIELELNKPVYLSVWAGTTKNELRVIGSENGEFPQGMDDKELAFLYKVVWTNDEMTE
ncbi:hypothetical protein [Sporosarcina sp. Te-1]|uniref:hypothetical protein n=1 Tax=Sporosarcina sp. Te-1 TaxID=2818390 RepID=UPI001FB128A7|nr:hypothetical protein [Sporosarcina sp. Te-1]